jgi:hypothetical protein
MWARIHTISINEDESYAYITWPDNNENTSTRICLLPVTFIQQLNDGSNYFRGFNTRANYTDRATAACRRS